MKLRITHHTSLKSRGGAAAHTQHTAAGANHKTPKYFIPVYTGTVPPVQIYKILVGPKYIRCPLSGEIIVVLVLSMDVE